MTLLVNDSFTESGTNSVSLLDHVGESGATWKPKPEYDGTIRVLGAASQYVYSNPLDGREAMYVASGGPAPSSWQLKASYIAAGGVSGCGETLSKGSATITAAGVGATATLTVTSSGGSFNNNIYIYDGSSNFFFATDTFGINSSGNTTTDAAAFAASINARTSAHGFSASSSGANVIVTAPGGAWPNGWLLQGSSGGGGAVMTFNNGTFSGGTNGSISSLTVNGVNIIPSGATLTASITSAAYSAGGVYYSAVIAQYATALSNAINAQASSPDYSANTTANVVNIIAAAGSGSTPNGFVVASTVTNVTRSHANMGGGGGYVNPDNRLAVCWGVQPGKKSFYRLREVGVGSALWAIERVDNGVITQLATTATPSLPNGAECPVVISYAGGRMTVSFRPLNVQSSVSYTDASPLPDGYFGIWGSGGGTTVGSFPNQIPQKGIYLLGMSVPFVAGTNDGAVTVPSRIIAATGTGSAASSAGDLTALPLITLVAQADFLGYVLETLPLPTLTATVFVGTTVVEQLPDIVLSATALVGTGYSVDATLPSLTIVAATGSAVVEHLPVVTLAATAVNGNTAAVDELLPVQQVDATLTPSYFISVDSALPSLTDDATITVNGVTTFAEQLPMLLFSGAIVTGNPATVLETLPLLQSAALANAVSAYAAALTLPVLQVYADAVQATSDSTARAWVMNLRNEALTEYTNFGFNSMTYFNGKYIGASDAGIVELGVQAKNDDTTPIAAVVREGVLDHGSSFLKRLPYIYAQIATDGDVTVSTITNEYGRHDYLLAWNGMTTLTQRRAKLGRGIKSAFIQLEWANRNGSSLRLRSHDDRASRGPRRMQ